MKKIFVFAAAAAALVSCNKNVFQGTGSEELYGSISLGVNAESEMLVTKASAQMSGEQLANYNITLTKIAEGGNTVVWDHLNYSYITENTDWKVPAGTYSLEVENYTIEEAGAANEGKGAVRVLGATTENFTVAAGKATDVAVECIPQNSRLSFAADKAFNSVFSSANVTATYDTRTVKLGTPAQTHETSTSAYFEPVTVNWTLTAKTALDNPEKTFNGTVTLVQAKWNQVTFTTKNGAINITVSVDGEITEVHKVDATIDPLPNK